MKAIKIGVSACLLGEAVRYDGTDKRNAVVTDQLCRQFECIPICPEMAIGLDCPRPPVQLVKSATGIRAVGRDDASIDITDRLVEYSNQLVLDDLSGFVLKSRSPSCGVGSTPLFDTERHQIDRVNGLFAETILRRDKTMPVIEESDLVDEALLNTFIINVRARCN
jgi:uncharacterized protein YbbK (DUF523 family)